jgi:hypothetical protein
MSFNITELLLYLLSAIELSPGGSTQLHTNNTQNNTNKNTQNNTNSEKKKSAGRAPSKNASFTLAFALQLRKN